MRITLLTWMLNLAIRHTPDNIVTNTLGVVSRNMITDTSEPTANFPSGGRTHKAFLADASSYYPDGDFAASTNAYD